MSTTIRHEVDQDVLTVVLNRPDRLNAFTTTMADELEATFDDVARHDDIRAVVVTGAGRAFCAGMDLDVGGNVFGLDGSRADDLGALDDLDALSARAVRDPGGRVSLAIRRCRKPVVAAINGPAVGVGATLTLSMDARLVSPTARFGLVFGRLGITPEALSSWYLPRLVGTATALDLVYSAEVLDAERTVELGLARSVHPADELLQAARSLVDRWTLGRSGAATALTRKLLLDDARTPEDCHRAESRALLVTSVGDGAEGVQAFREKRRPAFTEGAATVRRFS